MSIQLFTSAVIYLAGDGTSVSVEVNLRKLGASPTQSLPLTKIISVTPTSVSPARNLPTASLKGDVVTFTFDSPLEALSNPAVSSIGEYSLGMFLTFDSE